MFRNKLVHLLESFTLDSPNFPLTILYNEGWLLRLILEWYSNHPITDHPLTFLEGSTWFSEAILPSAFLARHRGDPLAEASTHLDGVIGHFIIGEQGKTDLALQPDATQFVALEAKLFSSLSAGVKHASYYDQAARTVACMAEVLHRANREPSDLDRLGFCLLAPASQIEKNVITRILSEESILKKVERRVGEYQGAKAQWFSAWFQPTLQHIEICAISWEALTQTIKKHDRGSGEAIESFYARCVEYNR